MGYVDAAHNEEIERLEQAFWEKERELRELRSALAARKAQASPAQQAQVALEQVEEEQESLEEAVRRYEKAAGILSALALRRAVLVRRIRGVHPAGLEE